MNNDGTHFMAVASARVALKAGKYPILVHYHQFLSKQGLEIYYEGPRLSRQRIPNTALWRTEGKGASARDPRGSR